VSTAPQTVRAKRPTQLIMNNVQTQTHLTNVIGRKPVSLVNSFVVRHPRQELVRSQSLPAISSHLTDARTTCQSSLYPMCTTGTYPLNSPQGITLRTCLPDLSIGCNESAHFQESPPEDLSPDNSESIDQCDVTLEDGKEECEDRETTGGQGGPLKSGRTKLQRWRLSPMQRRKIEKQMHVASTELRIS